MRKKRWLFLGRGGVVSLSVLAVLLLPLVGGCTRSGTASRPTLHLSMIPTTDPGKIVRESQPFIDYLEKETGTKVELTVPTNYAAVVEAVAESFAKAMLKLDEGNSEQKPVLQLLNASKYVKAEDSSYDPLRKAARDAGLLQ